MIILSLEVEKMGSLDYDEHMKNLENPPRGSELYQNKLERVVLGLLEEGPKTSTR